MDKRKRGNAYGRLTLLCLAAMATARMLLLMIDIIQTRAGGCGGEIAIPFYIILIFASGWKLREWTSRRQNKRRKNHAMAVHLPEMRVQP